MPRVRILVAEDTTLVRRLLVSQLSRETDFEVVGEAEDGIRAVEMAQTLHPDVVLMDLSMPQMNGIQATERIQALLPRTRIVLLTAHDDLAALGRFAGAAEALNKNCTPQEMVAAIHRAHSRPESAGDAGGDTRIERLAARFGLTERERAVVEKMTATEFTIAQIAAALAVGSDKPVTESAVKHTLERALTKMQIEPRTRAALVRFVLEARNHGHA